MSRRSRAVRREVTPDIRYNSVLVQKFMNRMMRAGKKSISQQLMYEAMDEIEARMKRPALEVFETAMRNVAPPIEVKPRRVGGSTYQVPVEVPQYRQVSLAIRWLLAASQKRHGHGMAEKLAAELMDAAQGTGAAVKRREETLKMAEANRAFAHLRW
ncbi:MAG: 30S ribosomal protein S7 [Anaerolineae bacterium]|jgi:small subunit ribosomal protein S7|nr:30S ribosomal protein S7 [Anaerolineae bacterium]